MKNEALKIDPVFKNFYTQKLKERCKDLKRYESIEELINIEEEIKEEIKEETSDNKIFAQDMSIYISITLYVFVFIFNGFIFNILHFNLKDIMFLILNMACSFLLMSLLLFFTFFPLYSFCQSIINIKRKPEGMSFRVFYSFFHLGIERYINHISRKIKINPDVFYNLIQETNYSENKKK